jgi:hypothetical protein
VPMIERTARHSSSTTVSFNEARKRHRLSVMLGDTIDFSSIHVPFELNFGKARYAYQIIVALATELGAFRGISIVYWVVGFVGFVGFVGWG